MSGGEGVKGKGEKGECQRPRKERDLNTDQPMRHTHKPKNSFAPGWVALAGINMTAIDILTSDVHYCSELLLTGPATTQSMDSTTTCCRGIASPFRAHTSTRTDPKGEVISSKHQVYDALGLLKLASFRSQTPEYRSSSRHTLNACYMRTTINQFRGFRPSHV